MASGGAGPELGGPVGGGAMTIGAGVWNTCVADQGPAVVGS